MPGQDNLYFVALIPPDHICDEIIAFKKDMADRFHSKAALKIVPHITLKAPFKLPGESHSAVVEWFKQLPVTQEPFDMLLKDFGAFDKRHPVIYVQPVANSHLDMLQRTIINGFKRSFPEIGLAANEKKFNPHLTIAYRDLSPASFRVAWREYSAKQYEAVFCAHRFHLLQHIEHTWKPVEAFSLPVNQ